jgi:eukaryotic-like serine/threonine-protein kinase
MASEEQSTHVGRVGLVGAWGSAAEEDASNGGSGERATSLREGDPSSGPDVRASRTPEPLAPGQRVGRYEIVELVGSGGAGKVYRALDPQLDRFVALKLLHTDPLAGLVPAERQARLLREARTLARLSHPNVVAAFDVGVHDGALFVAMEFIDRVSMRDWLAEPRSLSEIVRVLVAAGSGLAAAHAADVCHRDFKPANVMISSDGRVRVVDFGLARVSHVPAHTRDTVDLRSGTAGLEITASARAMGDTERLPLEGLSLATATAFAGTPGFMAPEQLSGQEADARSDQFSYAVTAFLALTGVMPYSPSAQTGAGAHLAWPRAPWHPKVGKRIRRVIERGLAADPSQRYPSLAAMVSALERAATARIHRGWTMALAATAATLTLAMAVARQQEETRCDFDESALAGVWDAERRSAVERAFQATGRSNQADAFLRVSGRLDVFRDEWPRHRRQACEAIHQKGAPSERILALQTACLDEALAGAKALVDALSALKATDVDRVAGAIPPSPGVCSNTSALSEASEPASPELQAEIAEVDRQIAGITALIKAGFRDASAEAGRLLLERARATGHAATIAKATFMAARANLMAAGTSQERTAAEELVKEGMRLAADSGQDRLLARMSTFHFYNLSYTQVRIEESQAMLPMVEALVSRVGHPTEPHLELLMGRSRIEIEHRRFSEALATLEEVRRLAPSAEDNVKVFGFQAGHDRAQIHIELGQFQAAVQAAQECVDGNREYFGPRHPRMLFALADLANAQSKAGLRDSFQETIAEARRIAATLPADEPRLKSVARAEGVGWEYLGECERALRPLNDALRLFTAAHGAEHPLTTGVLAHVGTCLAETGHIAEAVAAREQVLSNDRVNGAAPILVGEVAFDLAKLLWLDPKQRPRALALIEEASSLGGEEAKQLRKDTASWLASHASQIAHSR